MKLNAKKKIGFSVPELGSILRAYVFYLVPPKLLIQNQILVDADQKIALFWSAKSGATFSVKWFFAQKGLLEEATAYRKFVHFYRDDVYRFSQEHQDALGHFLKNHHKYETIKIVRHPLKRAVSSYIHAVKYDFAYDKMSHFLGRYVNSTNGFSFREFVNYLESLDIKTCNIHFQTQVHQLERRGEIIINHIVNLENSIERLSKLERNLGLRQTDLHILSRSIHHTKRTEIKGFYGDQINTVDGFERKNNEVIAPPAKNFYDADLLSRVSKIYADDFEHYGYTSVLDQVKSL